MSSMDDQAARQQYLRDEAERIRRREQLIEDRAYIIAGWLTYFGIVMLLAYALLGFLEGR